MSIGLTNFVNSCIVHDVSEPYCALLSQVRDGGIFIQLYTHQSLFAIMIAIIMAFSGLSAVCESNRFNDIVNPFFFPESGYTLLSSIDSTVWMEDTLPQSGFEIHISIGFEKEDGSSSAMLLFGNSNDNYKFCVSTNVSGNAISSNVLLKRTSDMKLLADGGKAVFNPLEPITLIITHRDGGTRLSIQIIQNNETIIVFSTEEITTRNFLSVNRVGIICQEGRIAYSDFHCDMPDVSDNPMKQYLTSIASYSTEFYRGLSEIAVQDIINNFWDNDYPGGRLLPTWDGYASNNLPDSRGALWEAGMLYFCIYDTWKATGNASYEIYLHSYANYVRNHFSNSELENAGGNQLWASDDCAWVAMLLLSFYNVDGDNWYLERAINLLENVRTRWYDPQLGGLRYKDGADFMSLYEVGIAICYYRIWELTNDSQFYDLALESYENMHRRLGADRSDGLYFCEANSHWPIGDANYIGEAGSTSFLAGNLGMAVLAAKFYHTNGDTRYLERVYQINEGLLSHYINSKGILINDRDAWTNGTYTAWYVSDVLSLSGTEEMQKVILDTALSIVQNARTEDGYYSGSWSGPADGPGSTWYLLGSVPQQSKTTGSTVLMITAAALLEAGVNDYVR